MQGRSLDRTETTTVTQQADRQLRAPAIKKTHIIHVTHGITPHTTKHKCINAKHQVETTNTNNTPAYLKKTTPNPQEPPKTNKNRQLSKET